MLQSVLDREARRSSKVGSLRWIIASGEVSLFNCQILFLIEKVEKLQKL